MKRPTSAWLKVLFPLGVFFTVTNHHSITNQINRRETVPVTYVNTLDTVLTIIDYIDGERLMCNVRGFHYVVDVRRCSLTVNGSHGIHRGYNTCPVVENR